MSRTSTSQALSSFMVVLLLITLASASVGDTKQGTSEITSSIHVVVTSSSLLWVVKEVGGDLVSVENIIPPGTDPHTYEPPPSQLVNSLKNADVVFITGPTHLPVELRIKELIKEGLVKAILIDYKDYVGHGLKILRNPKTGLPNPHGYLFSLTGLCAVAKTVQDVLSSLNPAYSAYFKARANALIQDLTSELSALRGIVPSGLRVGLAGPPLQYVAEELGLNVTFMLLPDVESEPSENDVAALINAVKTHEINVFLISDMVAAKNPKVISLVQRLGVPAIVVPVARFSATPQVIPSTLIGELHSIPSHGHDLGKSNECLGTNGSNGWELLHEFAVWLAACEAVLILVLTAVLIKYRRVIMNAALR